MGGPRRVGHYARLPATRDRRRVVARRAGDDRVGHARTRRRHRHHDPQPATRHCTAHAWSPATASNCRRLHTCTCSLPAVKSRSRAQGRCMKAMLCGSPHPAVSASPPRNPLRFSSGRCMRDCLRRKRIGAALASIVLVAACSTDSTGYDSVPCTHRRPGGGHRAGRSGSGPATVRRTASSDGARWMDDVGVGASPEGAAGRMGPGRKPAGVGAQQRSGRAHPAERGRRSADGAARRAGSAAWSGVLGQHPLRRRKRPDRRLRLRRRRSDQSPHRGGRVARCQESRSARCVFTRTEKRCRRPGWRVVLLHRIDGQHHRRRPQRKSAARHHHADPAGRRSRRAVRDRRAQRHWVWRSHPTVRCGRRSTTATMSRTRRLARSAPTTSTIIRPRPSPG